MATRNTKHDLMLRYHREEQIKRFTKAVTLVGAIVAFVGALVYTWWKVSQNGAAAPAPAVASSQETVKPAVPLTISTARQAPKINLDEAVKKYTGEGPKEPAKFNLDEALKKYTGEETGVALSSTPAAMDQAAATTLTSGKVGIPNMGEKRAAMEKVIRDFFEATTVDARLSLVRKPKTVRPYMEEYYARPALVLPRLTSIGEMRPLLDETRLLALASVTFAGDKAHKIVLEEKEGAFLIDWEGLATYSALPWKEFQAKMPKQSITMRVQASMGDFYFGNYTDKLRWACVEMNNPLEEGTIYGYFSRTDEKTAPLLGLINAANTEKIPLILDLFYEEEARPNQAMIRSLVSSGWLTAD